MGFLLLLPLLGFPISLHCIGINFSPIAIKKELYFRTALSFNAPSLGLPDFAALHRDKLLAHSYKKRAILSYSSFFQCSLSWARTKDPLINSQML